MKKRRRILISVILAGLLGLPWPFAAWMRERSRRAEAVRIAERAYFQECGQAAPTTQPSSVDRASSASVEWEPARHAYVVKFSSQLLSDSTRWGFFGRPVPFSSSTTIVAFEVTLDGHGSYLGVEMAGPY